VKEKCDGCELQRLAFSFNVTVYYWLFYWIVKERCQQRKTAWSRNVFKYVLFFDSHSYYW
jgi:hypothetical protein